MSCSMQGWLSGEGGREAERKGGDHQKARGSNKQGEEWRRGKAVMLPVSARPPGWHGRWQQLRLLQGLADLVVQS